ncbi:MAG: hypothetical protein ACKVOI_18220 [Dongiaceae bacterium]
MSALQRHAQKAHRVLAAADIAMRDSFPEARFIVGNHLAIRKRWGACLSPVESILLIYRKMNRALIYRKSSAP